MVKVVFHWILLSLVVGTQLSTGCGNRENQDIKWRLFLLCCIVCSISYILPSLAILVFPNSVHVTICHRLTSDDVIRPFLDQFNSYFIIQKYCMKKSRDSLYINTTDFEVHQRKYQRCSRVVPQPAYGYHTTTAVPQRNTNTHHTRSIQPLK